MTWWHPEKFAQKTTHLRTRAQIVKAARAYFESQNFTEVQTPILQIMPSPDTHIRAFETTKLSHSLKPIGSLGLHTSPEIAMKKLLVAGAGEHFPNIYQICQVFRNAEDGRLHSPEFTMLEWYRVGANYTAMMDDCEALLKSLGFAAFAACELQRDWQRISVTDAFKQHAGIDLISILGDVEAFKAATDVRTIETDTWEDVFHAIMAEKIEPKLGQGVPTFLYDYPISMAALACKAKDQRFAERFELYINGIELANAFSELTDPAEQRSRLVADMAAKKAIYDIDAPIDEDFLNALERGMPEASGCALGLDRLIMLACNVDDIEDVLWAGKP